MLVEVQALVSSAVYGTPQRSGTGFDLRRLNMLLAVLEKRCGFKLGTQDCLFEHGGGIAHSRSCVGPRGGCSHFEQRVWMSRCHTGRCLRVKWA